MIGIEQIGVYLPQDRKSNLDRAPEFDTTEDFIREKLGMLQIAVSQPEETAASMSIKAFEAIAAKSPQFDPMATGAVIAVTQTPSENIPHVSASIHSALGLNDQCACFDVSLGCSGYVYGINILKALMEANGIHQGLLFTCDPYSKIINPTDRNTALLFGDAATVTLLSTKATFSIGKSTLNTRGKEGNALVTREGILEMNGRAIYNFCATVVPKDIQNAAELNEIELENIDRFLFHQGSKYIVDTISRRLKLPAEKVVFGAGSYGNTVSSSIPLLLEKELCDNQIKTILLSGFGVGLSWASTVLKRLS